MALAATSCAPSSPTPTGREVNSLYEIFSWIALAIFLIVIGLIAWSIVRYRAKPGDEELPPQFHKNIPIELTYFAIPQLIVVGLFVISFFVLADVNALKNQPGDPPLVIHVMGFQWGWDFAYRGAGVTVESTPGQQKTLVLPVGRPIRFIITSRDVIHSFFLPDFLIKRDAIPGIVNKIQLTVDKPGTYRAGHCAEFCGLLHDEMYFGVKALPLAQFKTWLANQQGAAGGNH
jgi:cytochrome c oxidase subunit II